LQALRLLNFKFPTSVVSILDTFRIARELEVTASSLNDLLEIFQCPFDKLHCAGNDAHFILRVLLLLAVKSYIKEDAQYPSRLTILEEIAYTSIPHQTDPHAKAAMNKMKRLQRTRKHQSKFWDAEMQEKIRAERAAKRLATTSRCIL
jgi:DNA polymerase III alpha subunit (gram-positive type)